MIDHPQPPAAAYSVMARLLPAPYFTTRPPAEGVRLYVAGRDGVRTQWDMTHEMAAQIAGPLRKDRLQIRAVLYDERR